MQLANQLGIGRAIAGSAAAAAATSRSLGPGGQPLRPAQILELQRGLADFGALVSSAGNQSSLGDVLGEAELLGQLGGSAASLALLGASLVGQYGAAPEQLSALYYDNETHFPGVDNIVLSGLNGIPRSIAAGLGSRRLWLGTPVAAVAHGDTNASVLTTGGQVLTAQYVVCTAPLGVLQAGAGGGGGLALYPSLPDASAAALGRLGVGQLEMLWLQFAQPFWDALPCVSAGQSAPCERLEYLAAGVSGQPASAANGSSGAGWHRFLSLTAYTSGRPVLVALAAGDWAAQVAVMPEGDVVASAMAALAAMFPGGVAPAAPLSYQLSRWGADPWALGALSYYAGGWVGRVGWRGGGGRQRCRV